MHTLAKAASFEGPGAPGLIRHCARGHTEEGIYIWSGLAIRPPADRKDEAYTGLRQKTGLVVDRVCVRGRVEANAHRRGRSVNELRVGVKYSLPHGRWNASFLLKVIL